MLLQCGVLHGDGLGETLDDDDGWVGNTLNGGGGACSSRRARGRKGGSTGTKIEGQTQHNTTQHDTTRYTGRLIDQ